MKSVSVVLRVKNEAKTLDAVLCGVEAQAGASPTELVVVDSGSTDGTIEIAERHGARLVHIAPEKFTWGGAINRGFEAASGEIVALLSGHCVPVDEHWLAELLAPFADERVAATASRQIPDLAMDPFEAIELWEDFPPGVEPRDGGPYSNASGAVRRSVWERIRFDEALVSNEDGEWTQRVRAGGFQILNCPASQVVHSHTPCVDVVYKRLFWRALTGVQLAPGCRDGQWLYLLYRLAKYTAKDLVALWRDGRPLAWWRAPFYEIVRQGGRFAGARAAGRISMHSKYAGLEIPGALRALDPILRGLERPKRSHVRG